MTAQSGDRVRHDGRPATVFVVSDVSGYALIRYDGEPGMHRVSPSSLEVLER